MINDGITLQDVKSKVLLNKLSIFGLGEKSNLFEKSSQKIESNGEIRSKNLIKSKSRIK